MANLILPKDPAVITNIGELMHALAVGWRPGSADNRRVIGGDGGQFVRINPRAYEHCYYKPWRGDIPVISGYSIRGFVQFEAQHEFRGLFDVEKAPDGAWFSARLTQRGYEMACLGLLDVGTLDHPFFLHRLAEAPRDLELPPAASNPPRGTT